MFQFSELECFSFVELKEDLIFQIFSFSECDNLKFDKNFALLRVLEVESSNL